MTIVSVRGLRANLGGNRTSLARYAICEARRH